MGERTNPNLDMLERAVAQLGDLAADLILVGGCSTGFLITDPAAPAPRPTKDVDTIVEVASLQA